MKLRAIVRRMTQMCDPAWSIFIHSLQLSCAMLFCAWLLLLDGGDLRQLLTARALTETPQSVLLIGLLLSAVVEELYTRRS